MLPSDLFARLFRRRERPATMMDRFEITGLHQLSGSIEFRRDTASDLLVMFFVTLAVFLVVAMWVGSFSKQETMRGIVLGTKGGQRISAPVAGTVSHVWVNQGDTVAAGQRILTITPQQTAAGARPLSEAELQSLVEQRRNVRAQITDLEALMSLRADDLSALDDNMTEIAANLKRQERELQTALAAQEEIVRKLRVNLKAGYVTRENVTAQERVKQDYLRQVLEVRMQATQLDTTRLERRRTVQQTRSANAAEHGSLSRQLAELDARIERAKSAIATDVIAGIAGTMAALNVREGAEVKYGDTIAAIGNPGEPFTIGLQAPSKTMGLLTVGQKVVLKYDAFPYKTFGVKYGHIVAIGAQPLSVPKEDEQSALLGASFAKSGAVAPPQSKYLVEVEPNETSILAYGSERPILIGSTLSADVVVERRRLIDWVLDPILAMRGRT